MLLAKSIPGAEQVRFEAASILARIHIEQVLISVLLLLIHVIYRVILTMLKKFSRVQWRLVIELHIGIVDYCYKKLYV